MPHDTVIHFRGDSVLDNVYIWSKLSINHHLTSLYAIYFHDFGLGWGTPEVELQDQIGDPSDHADFWTFSWSFPIHDF